MTMMKRISAELQAQLDGPGMPPPLGKHSNFVNPPNLETQGLILIIFCLSVSTLAVCMRMWTKTRLVRKVVLEDWICCLVLITLAISCMMSHLVLDRAAGVHLWDVRLKDVYSRLNLVHIGEISYSIGMFLIKLAILLQYLRFFVPDYKRNKMFWSCHGLIWLNFIFYSSYICLTIFSCHPIKKGWSQQVYPEIKGSCLDLRAVYTVGLAINTASDLSIAILPQPVVWKLQISSKKKIGLSAIFLVGLFGCAASAIRLYYAVIVFYNQDFTYIAGATNLWSLVEITSGILAMCLTISPKFFRSLQDSKLWPVFKKRFRTKFRNRSRLPDGTEPVSVSRKGSDKKPTQDDHWMGTSHLLIMRTTHIVTHESTALPPDLENQPSVQPIG